MRLVAAICALVIGAHVGLWHLARNELSAPDYRGQMASVSYTPFDGSAHPDSGKQTTIEQVRADLAAIAPTTRAVRTYSSTGGSELVPEVASEFGLKVSLGAWIDKFEDRNERELRAVIDLSRGFSSVNGIIVGNETIYRADQTVADLIKKIQRVKRSVSVPVSTGEIWNVWLEHPELVSSVDFIAAHVLPYWEGISDREAVAQMLRIYNMLRTAYPGKRIVIAEFGWPSAGHNRRAATPGPLIQARVLREFLNTAESMGIEYNIIEAYDQPWKTFEGGVGPYWGMYDTSRQAEVRLDGPDLRSRPLEPRHLRGAGRSRAVGADPVHRWCDSGPGHHTCNVRPYRRRLVGLRLRLLDRPLFRPWRRLRLLAWHAAARAARDHRAGSDRGDRRDRLRTQAAAAVAGTGRHPSRRPMRRKCRSISPPTASRPRC